MKKLILFTLLTASAVACKKEKEGPQTRDIFIDAYSIALGDTLYLPMASALPEYEYDFGDGSGKTANAAHAYSKRGKYSLKLYDVGKSELVDEAAVTVGDRVITKVRVLDPAILVDKYGKSWENDGTGPDLYFNLSAPGKSYFTKTVFDVTESMLPLEYIIEGGVSVTSDVWTFAIRDQEGDPDLYQPMYSWKFKPVGYKYSGTPSPFRLNLVNKGSIEMDWEIR